MSIVPGQLVRIHSLQSAAGQKLNGKRGAVLRKVVESNQGEEDVRYQIKVEGVTPHGATSAIKATNLSLEPKLPLPQEGEGPRRGHVMTPTNDMCGLLAQLLVVRTHEYTPPPTMLGGFPAMAVSQLGQVNLTGFAHYQMEWLAGIHSMANVIMKEGDIGCEAVAFALLEGHPMYLDCLLVFMTLTPPICPEDEAKRLKKVFQPFNVMNTDLTPDQQHLAYIDVMKKAPLYLLEQLSKVKIGAAVFAAIQESQVWHLLVQRFLRLIAREGMGTPDGVELGPVVRRVFPHLCSNCMSKEIGELLKSGPLTDAAGQALIVDTEEFAPNKDGDFDTAKQLTKIFSEEIVGATNNIR